MGKSRTAGRRLLQTGLHQRKASAHHLHGHYRSPGGKEDERRVSWGHRWPTQSQYETMISFLIGMIYARHDMRSGIKLTFTSKKKKIFPKKKKKKKKKKKS